MHTIYIRDLLISATHGLYSSEKDSPQMFTASIRVTVSSWPLSDGINETLNYKLLRSLVIKTFSESPKNLLETLASEIADKALMFSSVEEIFVSLEKPNIFPDCTAGVSLTKKKILAV